ncbi:MAG: LapA family protein [Actinomycetia bacterium]|nr:LapA family protein [Actinomycetes bacterium]
MADDSGGMQQGDKEYTDKGMSFGAIIAVIVGVAALIFIFQNSKQQDVNFLFFSATVPLSVVIVISMLLGAIIGWFFGYMRRRRRRRHD